MKNYEYQEAGKIRVGEEFFYKGSLVTLGGRKLPNAPFDDKVEMAFEHFGCLTVITKGFAEAVAIPMESQNV